MKTLPIALLFLTIASSAAVAQSESGRQTANPSAAGAAADGGNGDEEIVVEGEVPKDKRRVCEMRTATGSIRPKRVCRTVAQIEQEEQAAREALDRVNADRESRDQVQLLRGEGG
jgi:hypothetical protein